MSDLRQDESYLIGSEQAIKALAKKDEAYVLLLSDSHGDYDLVYDILGACGSQVDAFLFCGDGIENIVSLFEEAIHENPEHGLLRKRLPPVIAFVRGNGDAESYDYLNRGKRERLIIPQAQNFIVCGKKIFLTHGHKYSVDFGLDYAAQVSAKLKLDYFFYGHTHIPRIKLIKQTKFINPGSCVFPRGGFPPTCALIKLHKNNDDDICDFYEIKKNRFGGIDLQKISIE